MTSRTLAGCFALIAIIAASCGGNVIGSGGGTGGAGGSPGTGGSSGTSGSGGTGGSPGTGAGGTGGLDGVTGDACTVPKDPGSCRGVVDAWWHDPQTSVCEPFAYGGCGGNANRYSSRDACQDACPGNATDFDACIQPTDCAVTFPGCCGSCGQNVSDHDLVAVNNMNLSQYHSAICPGNMWCGCPAAPPGSATIQYFAPTCRIGKCSLLDIRQTALTACQKASDCKLRAGAGCCEDCNGNSVVSVSRSADFTPICGTEPVGCDACAPVLQDGYDSACTDGHCTVVARIPP